MPLALRGARAGARCWAAVLASAALAAACDDDVIVDNYPLTSAVVHGTVTTSAGAPAAGASIEVTALTPDCAHEVQAADAVAGAEGEYRAVIGPTPVEPREVCLAVRASAGSGAQLAVVVGPRVELRDTRGGTPPDSARIDLVLYDAPAAATRLGAMR